MGRQRAAIRHRATTRLIGHAFGCGVDVVELSRFQRALRRGGEGFLRRIFTDDERRYAQAHRFPVPHLAARFAAKEAVLKAMSQVDPQHPLTLRQIEICNDRLGRPHVAIRDVRRAWPMIAISLSHETRVAVAAAFVDGSMSVRRRRPASRGLVALRANTR